MKSTVVATVLLISFLCGTIHPSGCVDDLGYCYTTESDPYRLYGSITAYNEILQEGNATVPGNVLHSIHDIHCRVGRNMLKFNPMHYEYLWLLQQYRVSPAEHVL